MNKLFLIAVAIACSGAVAQEKEIWACQQSAGTVMKYEQGEWEIYRKAPSNILLTIDGPFSNIKIGDENRPASCTNLWRERFSCVSVDTLDYITLDKATGKAGYSFLGGSMHNRDSISVGVYNCTKF